MIVKNLIKQQLIQKGTWLGVQLTQQHAVKNWRVEQVLSSYEIMCWDHTQNQLIKCDSQQVVQVDGMSLHRFCAQADLDAQGEKIMHLVRRGRKPKNKGSPTK